MTRPLFREARHNPTHDGRRTRMALLVASLAVACVTAFVLLACDGANDSDATSLGTSDEVTSSAAISETGTAPAGSTPATPTPPAPPPAPEPAIIIAWQPSHQDDTGRDWHEWKVCGDIVDRTIALAPAFRHVKAWETGLGLTGTNNYRPSPTNTHAFDSEVDQANDARADVFVSVHVDGGAPSGILGECMPGDVNSRVLCENIVADLCEATGLPDRGVREVRLYSLETPRNEAPLRILLELGDNEADRALLMSDAGRDALARALADAVRAHVPRAVSD